MKIICTLTKLFFNILSSYHTDSATIRQDRFREKAVAFATAFPLLLPEGLAVGALVHSRILLMGADQDLVQGAVVLVAAMMGALSDGTFDTLVSMAIHNERPPLIWIRE